MINNLAKKKRRKQNPSMFTNPVMMKNAFNSSGTELSNYDAHRKLPFKAKKVDIKVPPKNTGDSIEKEYEQVEKILGNKNPSYGYGDSKNRDKVLQFITDMKTKQV
jgi:hypothetical protein